MMNSIKVGLLGSVINNDNLGCQALAYSIIDLLERISRDLEIQFHYNIFEWLPNSNLNLSFSKRIGIDPANLTSIKQGSYRDFLHKVRHYFDNHNMDTIIKSCDFIIDLTEGDSFTDIYGQDRFNDFTLIKERALGVSPVILGSQTYGPFQNPENEKRAADVIRRAEAVFTRDRISGDYVKKISGVTPILTCDLAFRLPYESRSNEKTGCAKRIGFNISGLLVSDKQEGTSTEFTLKTNYDAFVRDVLDYLISHQYEVHLIGHVAADYTVNKILKEKYPSIILAPEFDNPMDAKSYISSMDLFIGSRMHATIAALTSNTPVVPVAYSRKFTGLFENVDYPYVVDLQTEDTNEAVQAVIDRIENYDETKIATEKSYQIAMRQNDECLKAYETVIRKVLSNR
jgi:colanic acid/amylovoran biosynthesis protein